MFIVSAAKVLTKKLVSNLPLGSRRITYLSVSGEIRIPPSPIPGLSGAMVW